MHDHFTTDPASVRIAGDHGYRIEGDTAFLNAELAIDDDVTPAGWALQLWACDNPHSSGPMVGVKVAEAPVDLPGASRETFALRVEVAAFAVVPAERREYSMVLVLASGAPGAFNEVHDFANYARRESFEVPHLEGTLSYALDEGGVWLRAERIRNPRAFGTLSGTLALELWTTRQPNAGGSMLLGAPLARALLGELAGQSSLELIERRVAIPSLPAGDWNIVLALSEWTDAAGFVTRDFCNFVVPLRTPAPVTAPEASAHHSANGESSHVFITQSSEPAYAAPVDPAVNHHPVPIRQPSHEAIALAAYFRFLARGDGSYSPVDDWLAAEQDLIQLQ
jgi:hypothetical protein